MSNGLDKAARLRAEEQEESERVVTIAPLEPPFPFYVIEFDPSFFGIEAGLPAKIDEEG